MEPRCKCYCLTCGTLPLWRAYYTHVHRLFTYSAPLHHYKATSLVTESVTVSVTVLLRTLTKAGHSQRSQTNFNHKGLKSEWFPPNAGSDSKIVVATSGHKEESLS